MRKRNYAVGYEGEGQVVYGGERLKKEYNCGQGLLSPLTLHQAKKLSKEIITPNKGKPIKSVIYKLVKIK